MLKKRGKPPKRGSVPTKISQEIARLKELIGDGWLDVLGALAPELQDAIDNFTDHVPCPVHGGKDGFRFFSDGEETGGGICNTCRGGNGFHDGIELLKWVKRWDDIETVQAICEYLGTDSVLTLQKKKSVPLKQGIKVNKVNPKAKARIDRILDETVPDTHNRISEYFESRGLDGKVPSEIHYHPGLDYFENGKKIGNYEAMVAPVRLLNGKIVSLLITYLDDEGPGKAKVETAKKLIPALWKGATKGAAIKFDEPEKVLCIAEGIETALAASQSVDHPLWAAVSATGMENMNIPDCVDDLIIYSDNDKKQRGQKAADKLCDRQLKKTRFVKVVTPPEAGKDWLDVLNEQGAEALITATEEAPWYEGLETEESNKSQTETDRKGKTPDPPAKSNKTPMDEGLDTGDLNMTHFIVDINGKVCIGNEVKDPQTHIPNITLSSVSDLRLRYANHLVSDENDDTVADLWLESENRREYKGLVFSPEGDIPNFYNLFFGFAVEPKAGDCSLYWDHVRENICNSDPMHYSFVRKWMSHAVQHPGKLPGTALVIHGLQGTGKGIFTDFFGSLFGQHYLTLYSLSQITGRFNSHLKNILLVHANEAIWGGNKASEGVLKGIITDPTTPIEFKGRDIISVRNYKRLIVATNEDWAVPLGMDDRRFLVMEVNPKFKENKAYFGAIVKQMKNGGLQALMHDLLAEDLEGFDVRTVPYSSCAFNIKMRGATPIQLWWYEKLVEAEHDRWDFDPPKQELHWEYRYWCKSQGLKPESQATFGKAFMKFFPGGYIKSESRKQKMVTDRDDMNRPIKGVLKRVRCYDLPSLEKCRECFEILSKSGPEIWPKELEIHEKPQRVRQIK